MLMSSIQVDFGFLDNFMGYLRPKTDLLRSLRFFNCFW